MRSVAIMGLWSAIAASAISQAEAARAPAKPASSGETQVVAKAGGREVTLSELRMEMSRLGLSVNAPDSERIALDSIISRMLLAAAARAADLHRKPDAVLRMKAAEEQALADLYLAISSQPPEPTPEEIEDYIGANQSLFAERRVYDFMILTLPSDRFDEKSLAPLFDDSSDFEALASALEASGAPYSIAAATHPSTGFPTAVREQLARYAVSDNIVIKGAEQTQIMKIARARREPLPASEWRAIARRAILDENAAKRAGETLERLRNAASIVYHRSSAAPPKSISTK
jgi:EpsD family peptidyl-prolyl cis-trans isomerase